MALRRKQRNTNSHPWSTSWHFRGSAGPIGKKQCVLYGQDGTILAVLATMDAQGFAHVRDGAGPRAACCLLAATAAAHHVRSMAGRHSGLERVNQFMDLPVPGSTTSDSTIQLLKFHILQKPAFACRVSHLFSLFALTDLC